MSHQVTAEMTGVVYQLLVEEGDIVEAGQTIVLLEAMKMEMPVLAPIRGKVAFIAARENDAIDKGQLLMTLE